MKFFSSASMAGMVIMLAACDTVPPLEPIERKPNAVKTSQGVVRMTVREALDRYATTDYGIRPDDAATLNTVVHFDTSLPWQKALAQALEQAGVAVPAPTAVRSASPAVTSVGTPVPVTQGTSKLSTLRSQEPSSHLLSAVPGQPKASVAPGDAPATVITEQTWLARPNVSLRETLEQWCRTAGWDLSWNVKDEQTNEKRDFTLGGGMQVTGTFNEAVKSLFAALPKRVNVQAELWSGNKPPLLYVFNDGADK